MNEYLQQEKEELKKGYTSAKEGEVKRDKTLENMENRISSNGKDRFSKF